MNNNNGRNPNRGNQGNDWNEKKFTVNIPDEEFGGYGQQGNRQRRDRPGEHYNGRQQPNRGYGPNQRAQGQRRQPDPRRGSDTTALQRRDIPVSRTRIITSRAGDNYEIPEENNLPPKLMRRQQTNQKSRGCVVAVVYAIIVLSISALLSFYLIVGINDMFALMKEEMEIVVTVQKDATLDDVTKLLEDNGVVDYPYFFKMYAGLTNDEPFKYGEFTLNKKMDYDMILRKLTKPSTADKTVVRVTIPEGKNLQQIAYILEDYCVCEQEAFFDRVKTYEYKHSFYKKIPINEEKRYYKLEGYLFPDTYVFYIWEGSKDAINKMLNAFDEKVYSSKEIDFVNKANQRGMSMDQIITLASIIERETGDPEQMKNVASVFYNRMKNKNHDGIGGKLQSDATRWYPYATQKDMLESDALTKKEKDEWVSSYDTTTFAGLPPGPICCPSLNAIKAALEPNNTDYYYFYTAEDSEGKMQYYYAKTLAEHENNYKNH